MEKKLNTLRAALEAGDRAKIMKAASALVAYDRKHPFAVVTAGGNAEAVVNTARRYVQEFSKDGLIAA